MHLKCGQGLLSHIGHAYKFEIHISEESNDKARCHAIVGDKIANVDSIRLTENFVYLHLTRTKC